jgi:hypothetical protein
VHHLSLADKAASRLFLYALGGTILRPFDPSFYRGGQVKAWNIEIMGINAEPFSCDHHSIIFSIPLFQLRGEAECLKIF